MRGKGGRQFAFICALFAFILVLPTTGEGNLSRYVVRSMANFQFFNVWIVITMCYFPDVGFIGD